MGNMGGAPGKGGSPEGQAPEGPGCREVRQMGRETVREWEGGQRERGVQSQWIREGRKYKEVKAGTT